MHEAVLAEVFDNSLQQKAKVLLLHNEAASGCAVFGALGHRPLKHRIKSIVDMC